jgi:hypothetical protein
MNGNLFRNGMVVLALLAAMSTPAFAKFYSYSTGSTTTGGVSVDAKATFDVSAGSMIVTLTNLQPNIKSVGQDISSLWFTVNNGQSILDLSGATTDILGTGNPGSGNLITIGANGKVTSTSALTGYQLGPKGTSSQNHWSAGQGSSQFYLNDLNGGGSPDQTIIGPGNYSTVNSSIYGNGSHNPFIQNQATFKIAAAGLLATSTISDIKVGFGTTPGCNTVRMVPEPGSLALLAIGALAFAGVLRRKTIEETHA